jgi:hypothetical protein
MSSFPMREVHPDADGAQTLRPLQLIELSSSSILPMR